MAVKDFAGLARGNAGNGLASSGLGGPCHGDKRGTKPAVAKDTKVRDTYVKTKMKDTGLS